jgi:hypothetical protein
VQRTRPRASCIDRLVVRPGRALNLAVRAVVIPGRYSGGVKLRFEWDSEKAKQNLSKHGVSFEEASTVFDDPLSLTVPDPRHSVRERRFAIMGSSAAGDCWSWRTPIALEPSG